MVETLTYDALSSNGRRLLYSGIGDTDAGIICFVGIIDPGRRYENFFLHSFSFSRRQPAFDHQNPCKCKSHGDVEAKARSRESSEMPGMPLRRLDADKDFAMLKTEHVRRTH